MSEIDRQLDAAWRAASREQPPEALDASIRAAARRAVAAGPGKPKSASWWRAKTHWAPLAAAAAVAVIAVGILQLTPPEQLTPGLIADRSISTRGVEMDSRKPSSPSTIAEPARRDAALVADQLSRERDEDGARKRLEQASASMQSPSNTIPEKKQSAVEAAGAAAPAERQLAAVPEQARSMKPQMPSGETAAVAARGEPLQAPTAERAQSAKLKKDEGESPAKLASSEPFPAAMGPARTAEQMAATPPPPAGKEPFPAAAPAQIGSAAPVAPPAPRSEAFPAAGPQDKAAANVPGPATPMREAPSPQVAGALASRAEPLRSQAVGLAKVATADQPRTKDAAAPRPADEWIKLIRRLRSEGKTEEAAKELAAFRAAYKERADELLPVDLREAKKP